MVGNVDVPKLERSLSWALEHQLPASELVAMLRPLVQHTQLGTERGLAVRLQLAENLLMVTDGGRERIRRCHWEAATLLHSMLPRLRADAQTSPTVAPLLARALSAFGLACTFLEQYRLAKRAYLQALKQDPTDAVAAHNLGHLLSAKLGAPLAGLYWLQRAHAGLPEDVEVTASFAHALVKTSQVERALALMARALNDSDAAHNLVTRWLNDHHHAEQVDPHYSGA